LLEQRPAVPWLEVHAENYLVDEDARTELESIRRDYPLSMHCVGLSLGSAAGVDATHIAQLKSLHSRLEPALISDHLSWSTTGGIYFPDLLPLPYTAEALAVTARNIDRVQSALGRELLIENPSTYLQFAAASLSEAEFLAELVERTGCGVLLDVNNIYVSACNRRVDPTATLQTYLDAGLAAAIGEIHLAGHAVVALEDGATVRIDDHGSRVCAAVWDLYEYAMRWLGPRPTLIEWDTALPEFPVLLSEAAQADAMCSREVS